MQLRVEYSYDPESRNWAFRVPALGIVGGAETRQEAEQAVLDALAYALEDEIEITEPLDSEIQYLELAVQR